MERRKWSVDCLLIGTGGFVPLNVARKSRRNRLNLVLFGNGWHPCSSNPAFDAVIFGRGGTTTLCRVG